MHETLVPLTTPSSGVASVIGQQTAAIPAAAAVTGVKRARAGGTFRVSTFVFPSPPGFPSTSVGSTCDRSGSLCDPTVPDSLVCFGGSCNEFGGEDTSQNVTLDDTLGSAFGNPASQGDEPDGLLLRSQIDLCCPPDQDAVVFVIPPGSTNGMIAAQASGFLIDANGDVVDTVGPQ